MKKFVLAIVASSSLLAMPALARSGAESPTVDHDNPSSCLGAERASRNSNGGDRAQGAFGPAQAAYVASLNAQDIDYGQWLQDWKDSNCE